MKSHVVRALRAFALVVFVAAGALGPAIASAEETEVVTRETPAESRATEFRAVRGAEAERVPGGTLLIAAYGVAWVLILLFVVRMGRIETTLARDVERLERTLLASESDGDRRS